MNKEYMVPACSGIKIEVKKGQNIIVVDMEGKQVVDFFAEAEGNPAEFLSTGVTIDCNESLKLKVGDYIYTNLYHPMLKVIADDVGEHDAQEHRLLPLTHDYDARGQQEKQHVEVREHVGAHYLPHGLSGRLDRAVVPAGLRALLRLLCAQAALRIRLKYRHVAPYFYLYSLVLTDSSHKRYFSTSTLEIQ